MAQFQIVIDIDTGTGGPTAQQVLNVLAPYWSYTGPDTFQAKAAFAKAHVAADVRRDYIAARRDAAGRAAGNAEAAAAQTVNFS